ncbi:MAG: hypothetical protein IPM45_05835 [Acidimicrobiales bacterium]|nr:hypothetical protein [Acidimicrobiales bacterium]
MAVLQVVAFSAGAALVVATALSAVRTVVLPRAVPSLLGRVVFVAMRYVFGTVARPSRPYEARDRVMALYAPVTLLVLPGVWLLLVVVGFTGIFWALGVTPIGEALAVSGSSMTTLGFERPDGLLPKMLAVAQAALGLGLVALLISFLPSLYGAFARRETAVSQLEVLADTPPSAAELLVRHVRIGGLARLDPLWLRWQELFADLEESHTSFPALCFFRSPQPDRSWLTASGCVLDAAALTASTVDIGRQPEAELCLRAGYVTLRRIADVFSIAYDPDPRPDDPIAVARDEFEAVVERLQADGVPVRADRDQAWRDFAGWRVNYDAVLLGLSGLVMAPVAPWSSDRALAYRRPPLLRIRGRARPSSPAQAGGRSSAQRRRLSQG